jgi:hypothetical protein
MAASGMDILNMPKTEDGSHRQVLARGYISRWADAQLQTQGASEKVAEFFDEEVICRLGTPGMVVMEGGAGKKKWTDRLLKCYNIRKITVTLYQATAHSVIE